MTMLTEQYNIVLVDADTKKQQGFLVPKGGGHTGKTHGNDRAGYLTGTY